MPIGTTLETMLDYLRMEVGDSTNPALGLTKAPVYSNLLRRTQDRLYNDHNWQHLVVDRDQALQAGERYYTFDPSLNFQRIGKAWIGWNYAWHPIDCGFEPVNYNDNNPERNTRTDPVQAWRHYEINQFEVWPMPASSGQTIRFRGIKSLSRLTALSDRADLDDTMLVLFAAAEILARGKMEDASAKLSQAQAHYMRLKGQGNKMAPFIVGGGIHPSHYRDSTIRVNPL